MGVSTIKKITFIGAGSYIFARNLIKDILTFPAFEDANIVLMDIDEDRLNISKNAIECIIDKGNYSAKLNATTNRAEALGGADGVLSAVTVGSYELYYAGVDLPMNYGVDYSVGDTRGIPGIFAYLRTIPTMLDICRDIEKYCPDAIFLNYTNPMSMICRTLQSETKAKVIGLCHSVQNTAEMLAQWIDADIADITYTCAGINHQAWYLEYKYRGKDAYPLILKAIEDGDVYNKDIVRNEMFKHLGYYVTESSKHNSEYNPWFRKRPDLIQKYVPGTHAHLRNVISRRVNVKEDFLSWAENPENLKRSNEYAGRILNAVMGDGESFCFNGNLPNSGLIDNLPNGCCVEVPVRASLQGIEPIRIGMLPNQLAALNNINAYSEELAVEGSILGEQEKIYQACYYDPLASAVLSLDEIRALVRELFEVNRDYLTQFSKF